MDSATLIRMPDRLIMKQMHSILYDIAIDFSEVWNELKNSLDSCYIRRINCFQNNDFNLHV